MENRLKRLSIVRKARGYTQEELAKKLCVNVYTVSRFENGTKKPSLDLLVKIADILDVSLDWLLDRQSYRKKE